MTLTSHRRVRLSKSQRRALEVAGDAPMGLVRLTGSFHGTADGEGRVLTKSLQALEREGLVEWRTERCSFGTRCFVTDAGRAQLDRGGERASQGSLFGEGGFA